jgi:hypothetical protein
LFFVQGHSSIVTHTHGGHTSLRQNKTQEQPASIIDSKPTKNWKGHGGLRTAKKRVLSPTNTKTKHLKQNIFDSTRFRFGKAIERKKENQKGSLCV